MDDYLTTHPLTMFLAGWPLAFAAGIVASPHYYRLLERLKPVMQTSRIWVLSFALLAVVSSGTLVYTVNANSYLTRCLSALLEDSTKSSQPRAAAAADRDDALRRLIDLRVTQGLPADDPAVLAAVTKFEEQSDRLDLVRAIRPIPSFTDYCKSRLSQATS